MENEENAQIQQESLDCPLCGNKMEETQWSWRCECGFKVSKELFGTKFSSEQMKQIFAGNSPEFNLVSKAGNIYTSKVRVDAENKNLALGVNTDISCPLCGKKLIESAFSYECPDRTDCNFRTSKTMSRVEITPEMLKAAIEGTSQKTEFYSEKKKKPFDAYLVVDAENKKLGYSFDAPKLADKENPISEK